jgi:hypothetical protein
MPRKTTSPAPKVFTDAFLKKLAVPRDKKDIVLFDDGTGLGVRKSDRGVISFLIQIRLRDGRRWRETFKTSWPTLTIAAARDALKVRAAGLALGSIPSRSGRPLLRSVRPVAKLRRRPRRRPTSSRCACSCGAGTIMLSPTAARAALSERCEPSN